VFDRVLSLTLSVLLHVAVLLFLTYQMQKHLSVETPPELDVSAVELSLESGHEEDGGAGGPAADEAGAAEHSPLPSVERVRAFPDAVPKSMSAEALEPSQVVLPVPSKTPRLLDVPVLPPDPMDAREIAPTQDELQHEAEGGTGHSGQEDGQSDSEAGSSGSRSGGGTSSGGGRGGGSGSGAVLAAPSPYRAIRPVYPFGSRRRGEEGTVTLEVEVSPAGIPNAVRIVSSSGFPALDLAAQRAVLAARFKPARRDGEPVTATAQVSLVFRLTDR
jgi:protein TonB